jgi:hypothetical protein
MTTVSHLMLDVLKPHEPTAVDFARALAERVGAREVAVEVREMDDRTQTLEVMLDGDALDPEDIAAAIGELGASLHSVDRVVVRRDDSVPA